MKYAIGWESNGKQHPYYRESMSTSFPGSPQTMGFVAFSCTMENLWGNPCLSHMMKYSIEWESNGTKALMLMGKVWVSISQTFFIPKVFLHFLVLWEIDGKIHAFPIWWPCLIFFCVCLCITSLLKCVECQRNDLQSLFFCKTPWKLNNCYCKRPTIQRDNLNNRAT